MGHWWERNIVEPGKLPLLLCFVAFIATFLTTRAITRSITLIALSVPSSLRSFSATRAALRR